MTRNNSSDLLAVTTQPKRRKSRSKEPCCICYPHLPRKLQHTLAFHFFFTPEEEFPEELQGKNTVRKFESHLYECERCADIVYEAGMQFTRILSLFLYEGRQLLGVIL